MNYDPSRESERGAWRRIADMFGRAAIFMNEYSLRPVHDFAIVDGRGSGWTGEIRTIKKGRVIEPEDLSSPIDATRIITHRYRSRELQDHRVNVSFVIPPPQPHPDIEGAYLQGHVCQIEHGERWGDDCTLEPFVKYHAPARLETVMGSFCDGMPFDERVKIAILRPITPEFDIHLVDDSRQMRAEARLHRDILQCAADKHASEEFDSL